mmetsp:Transcript_7181/g.21901  ORF Transcript_7181/g.21901 Transcript_7181/m.21901 type:complete len:420 (+) Transcript_7181:486-1745(+)
MAVRVGRFILLETIGQGSFAKVKLAIEENSMRRVAVKVFDRRSLVAEDFENDFRREVRIMQYLRHNNIVKVHQVLMSTSNFYMVMELVSGGELYYEIVNNRRLDVNRSRRYFQQLIDAMCYCHAMGVYHRDLKPENLLIDENDCIKITDFGMSCIHEIAEREDPTSNRACRTQCGTPKYMAPEVIMTASSGYNGAKIDTWDCGLILYAMVAGFLPFNGNDDRQVFRQIVFGRIRYPEWFDDSLRDLLSHMLEKDPDARWSLEDVRQHEWFNVDYYGAAYYERCMTEVRAARRARAERGRGHQTRGSGSTSRGQSRSRSRSTANRTRSRTLANRSQRHPSDHGARSRSNSASQRLSGQNSNGDRTKLMDRGASAELAEKFNTAAAISDSNALENQDINLDSTPNGLSSKSASAATVPELQ